jgi:hypothetical protein
MSDQPTRPDNQNWDKLSPEQVLEALVYELYHPVSTLGSQLKRLTGDDDPISEEEYEAIFAQMDSAVRQLSKTVVHLKRYNAEKRQG